MTNYKEILRLAALGIQKQDMEQLGLLERNCLIKEAQARKGVA